MELTDTMPALTALITNIVGKVKYSYLIFSSIFYNSDIITSHCAPKLEYKFTNGTGSQS